jgi:hypothetical protein
MEVVALPDVALQQPGVGTGCSPLLDRTPRPVLKILRGHENLRVLDDQSFSSWFGYCNIGK